MLHIKLSNIKLYTYCNTQKFNDILMKFYVPLDLKLNNNKEF